MKPETCYGDFSGVAGLLCRNTSHQEFSQVQQPFRVCFAFCSILLASVSAFGQSGGVAGISGVVRDPSGAVIPDAKVVISSESRGLLRTLETNDAGLFSAPALTPGSGYQVSVTAAGFAGYQAKDLILQVGQNLDLRIVLTVASDATKVEVVASQSAGARHQNGCVGRGGFQVDQGSADQRPPRRHLRSLDAGGQQRRELRPAHFPRRGRPELVPGWTERIPPISSTTRTPGAHASRRRSRRTRCRSSRWCLELLGRIRPRHGRDRQHRDQERQQRCHGTAYTFYRSTGFNARDPFASFVPSEKRTQTGGSLGGPIQKDKLFYFLNTEVTRRNSPVPPASTPLR